MVLIIGRKRYGKSALGHYIVEKLHTEQKLPCYIVGFPEKKQYLLPEWLHPIENVDILPDNCIALVDEASFKHHAHKVRGKETEFMDKLISVSGQKKQTIIFITHTMRKFAITLLIDVDLLLCKEPSLLHANLERGEVRKIMEEVKQEFSKLPRDEVKKSTYVISDGWRGFMRNPLPSFWSEELSEAWSGIDLQEKQGSEAEKREKTTGNEVKTYPERLVFRIWFKPEDKDRILDCMLTVDGKRLDPSAVCCTKDKCHLLFEMKHWSGGYYVPTSKRFNWTQIFEDMKDISYHLDTETSIVEGEPYPIPKDHLIFTKNKKTSTDNTAHLDEYSDKVKL